MGYINVDIDDDLEREVRQALPFRTAGKKGALRDAVEAGLRLWLAEGRKP